MKKYTSCLSLLLALAAQPVFAQNKTVLLDYYYNHETHKTKSGETERFHYTWEDTALSGYSKWGAVFTQNGWSLKSLETAPTKKTLAGNNVYIITDPDTEKETTSPKYMEEKEVKMISDWVKDGGILVMMANDSANAELPHFNKLAQVFGIRFSDTMINHVVKTDIESGKTIAAVDNIVFRPGRQLYLKDVSALSLSGAAVPVLKNGDGVVMAMAKYGKGTVFAVGDPWIYNEYIVTDRLTPKYQNYEGAVDFVKWLGNQVPWQVSDKEIAKWVKDRQWANGVSLEPHESVDKAMFYRQYMENKSVWDKCFQFIRDNKLEDLKPGKYPIDGDHAFATVTEIENKPFEATKWESHRRYIDFQYIVTGKEKIGVADASKATVVKPYTVDVMNYETEGKIYVGEPGKFFLFFPNDAHRPNIKVDGVGLVKKLVIKIEVAGY